MVAFSFLGPHTEVDEKQYMEKKEKSRNTRGTRVGPGGRNQTLAIGEHKYIKNDFSFTYSF